jgi:hypothetical protein
MPAAGDNPAFASAAATSAATMPSGDPETGDAPR